jgi:hypothetical protein
MPVRRLLVVSLLAGAMLGVGGADRATACSCLPLELDRQTFRESDGAVIGTLVEREPIGRRTNYVYVVRRVFRGRRLIEPGEAVAVRSWSGGAACGLETPIGGREGLFLERRRGVWTGNLCDTAGPREMRRAAERLGLGKTAACA